MINPKTTFILFLLTALCMITISGCMVGPNFSEIAPGPDAIIDRSNNWGDFPITDMLDPASLAQTRQWWKTFNDPVLNELISKAESDNLTLMAAGLRVLEAQALRGIAVGELFPQVQQINGNYSRVNLSENTANIFPVDNFDNYNMSFDVVWELDVWGRFRRGIEVADAQMYSSIMSLNDVWVTITAEIASAYFELCALDRRIELIRKNIDIQRSTLNLATVKYENGATTELDVQQARSTLKNVESFLPLLEVGMQSTKNRLCVLLGVGPGELNDMLSTHGEIPLPPEKITVGLPADLLRRRADIRQAELIAKAECARIGIAESELLPHFSLFGSAGFEAEDLDRVFTGTGFSGSIGPSFRWNILNYGRIENNVKAQEARFQQAIVNYRLKGITALNEVSNAMTAYIKTRDQVEKLTESVAATQRSFELASKQYKYGQVDFQRVLSTQSFLVQQQDSLASAKRDVVQNLIVLYKSLGGGWEITNPNNLAVKNETLTYP